MKNKIFKNVYVDKKLDDIILSKTILRPEKKSFNKKALYFGVFCMFTLFLSVGVVAGIKSYVINQKYLGNGDKQINISVLEKVKINENANLSCHNDLTLAEIEKELSINLLNYQSYNKENFDKCEIKRDINNNIQTFYVENDDGFSEYLNATTEERIDKNLIKKRYLSLKIKFITSFATQEDDTKFKSFELISGPEEYVDSMVEDYYIKSLGINVKIINLSSIIENDPWPNTMCSFVYNGVYYSFTGYYFTVEEMKEVLENLY